MEAVQKIENLQGLARQLTESYDSIQVESDKHLDALENLAFPTRRDEYWKYTRTNKISKTNWSFQMATEASNYIKLVESHPNRMVFINGYYTADLSTINSVEGVSIALKAKFDVTKKGIADPSPFRALNQSLPQAGYHIAVEKNVQIAETVHIIHIYDGNNVIAQPNNLLTVGTGSKVAITEIHTHLDSGATFSNIATEIELAANCKVGIDIIQNGTSNSNQLHQVDVVLPGDSQFTQNTFSLSGGWIRNNTNVRITGSNSTANLNGFYIPSQKEHVDNHTVVDHLQPHCDSNELYRGVLLDSSTAVFNGKVYVRPDAQKTNAFQSNGNILMSDNATINSKPELEIYADDVKCSHGSTTGQFDEVALFYLMARGISRKTAKKMLVGAFAEDVLEKLVNPELRDIIEAEIHRKLAN